MHGLDLFSGIGGLSLALKDHVTTVAYCENDRYAQGVLLSRMRTGELENAPIWDDVRTLRGSDFADNPEIIFGGFPCQDISSAGTGEGLEGLRSGLFFEVARLVDECRPQFVFLENVPAITFRGLDKILLAFDALGYDCRWTVVSADELGAPHERKRWFLLASNAHRIRGQQRGLSLRTSPKKPEPNSLFKCSGKKHQWETEPSLVRLVHGFQGRVDRIRCLGNSVVPQQAKEALERLMGLK